MNGAGLNGAAVLNATTVHDDGVVDHLSAGAGRDWFFGKRSGPAADVLLDRALDEVLVDLP